MGSASEHRQKKKAEKKRLAAKAEQKARRLRAQAPGEKAEVGADWSLGVAWASENWIEQGAQVAAVFSRRRPDGHVNAALFELDLADKGVVSAKVMSNLSDDRLLGEVGRRSEKTMHEVSPHLVARLVREASGFGESRGHAQPKALSDALALMGDVDGSDWTDPIKLGRPGEAQPAEPSTGIGARVRRWLFGDPVAR